MVIASVLGHCLGENRRDLCPPFPFQINHEEEEPDDEEMGVAETYAEYWPAKCNYERVVDETLIV